MKKAVSEVVLIGEHAEIIIVDKNGKEKCRSLISMCDVDKARNVKWYFSSVRGYVKGRVNGKEVNLHKFILNTEAQIDHINRNRLDNRRENLRPATTSENAWNQGIRSTNTTGYKGVSFDKNKYTAKIRNRSKQIDLGRYENPKDAAKAYDRAAMELHKEFALTNKMLGLI